MGLFYTTLRDTMLWFKTYKSLFTCHAAQYFVMKFHFLSDNDININEVPPLKTKGISDCTRPSSKSNARMTFSIRILSAFLFNFETLLIHSMFS